MRECNVGGVFGCEWCSHVVWVGTNAHPFDNLSNSRFFGSKIRSLAESVAQQQLSHCSNHRTNHYVLDRFTHSIWWALLAQAIAIIPEMWYTTTSLCVAHAPTHRQATRFIVPICSLFIFDVLESSAQNNGSQAMPTFFSVGTRRVFSASYVRSLSFLWQPIRFHICVFIFLPLALCPYPWLLSVRCLSFNLRIAEWQANIFPLLGFTRRSVYGEKLMFQCRRYACDFDVTKSIDGIIKILTYNSSHTNARCTKFSLFFGIFYSVQSSAMMSLLSLIRFLRIFLKRN